MDATVLQKDQFDLLAKLCPTPLSESCYILLLWTPQPLSSGTSCWTALMTSLLIIYETLIIYRRPWPLFHITSRLQCFGLSKVSTALESRSRCLFGARVVRSVLPSPGGPLQLAFATKGSPETGGCCLGRCCAGQAEGLVCRQSSTLLWREAFCAANTPQLRRRPPGFATCFLLSVPKEGCQAHARPTNGVVWMKKAGKETRILLPSRAPSALPRQGSGQNRGAWASKALCREQVTRTRLVAPRPPCLASLGFSWLGSRDRCE